MSFNKERLKRLTLQTCMAAFSVVIASMLSWPIPAAAQLVLESGRTHVITPAQTDCVTITRIDPDRPLPIANAQCDEAMGTADVTADDGGALLTVDVLAGAIFQLKFRVEEADGTAERSLIPIHVRVPNSYAFLLGNTHIVEFAGNARADILLQLRQDPDLDPGGRGTVIERVAILGATHGGIIGCLTIPKSPAGLAKLAIKCVAAALQRIRGNAVSSLDAIVEVGRTYNLELEILARASSVGGKGAFARTDVIAPPAPGLQWNEMIVTIGTDPAALVADLQDKIAHIDEKQIEDNLLACRPVVALFLPESLGGRAEQVRALVAERIDQFDDAVNAPRRVSKALKRLEQGDMEFDAGRFQEAYERYCSAYSAIAGDDDDDDD